MGNNTKKIIKIVPRDVSVEFTPARILHLKFVFKGSPEELQSVLEERFQYSLILEGDKNPDDKACCRLVVRNDLNGSILWMSENRRQVLEIIGTIVETGILLEECLIHINKYATRSYSLSETHVLPHDIRKDFKKSLEELVNESL